jgi:predicted  nucleic acid-binding Zn-ribbon protein
LVSSQVEAQLQSVQQDRDRKQAEIRSGTKALAEVNAKEEALHDEIDELKIQLEDLTGRVRLLRPFGAHRGRLVLVLVPAF